MSVDNNDVRQIFDRFVTLYNAHDPEGLAAIFAEGGEVQAPHIADPVRGRTAIRDYFRATFATYPDVRIEVSKMLIDGPALAAEAVATGTNAGERLWSGEASPATGRRLTLPFVSICEVAGGWITASRSYWDQILVREQLGLSAEQVRSAG